jgi:3-hydroxyisobutyrate dehydrogenase
MMLHEQTGICRLMKRGSYLIDHTTSTPTLAIKLAEEAGKHGVNSIDAPVSGGDTAA